MCIGLQDQKSGTFSAPYGANWSTFLLIPAWDLLSGERQRPCKVFPFILERALRSFSLSLALCAQTPGWKCSPLSVLRKHHYHLKTKMPNERWPRKCHFGGGWMGLLTALWLKELRSHFGKPLGRLSWNGKSILECLEPCCSWVYCHVIVQTAS